MKSLSAVAHRAEDQAARPPPSLEPIKAAGHIASSRAAASTSPRVELLWWSGCPSWEEARRILREEMAAAGLDPEELEVREVNTDEAAEREGFVGSPTIRVDGRDIQDPGAEPIGLSCRVYRLRDGRISALPDPADVRDALRAPSPAR